MAMTSKKRMILAILNKKPDRVPVAPDISNMIPARLTGKPFWDIYLNGDPPLWKAYIEAVKYFGFDGWFIYAGLRYTIPEPIQHEELERRTVEDRIIVRGLVRTPAGDMNHETTYYRADPPTTTKHWVDSIKDDLPKIRYLFQAPTSYDPEPMKIMRREFGELGAFGLAVGMPGFQHWFELVEGGIAALTYAYYDHPDVIEQLRRWHHEQIVKMTEMILETRPDHLLIGASGTITMQSPEIFRRLGLPTLKVVTRMAKEAGIPTMLHSCGKEWELVKICAEETDLDCINPLELPPMGDCDLAEVKREFGHRLSLMGNLHTTKVMLHGTVEDVEREAKKAIDDAGKGGGFILSTGDQCGRDTPDENIFRLVEVAETYGRYD